jgi:succinoglycan biosynthesis transport protein ExoP
MKYSLEMNDRNQEYRLLDSSHENDDVIDFDKLFAIVRRQWKVVALAVAFFAVLGIIYKFTATPIYSASTSILIDKNNKQIGDKIFALEGVLDDESSILSQVELLKSQKIARNVSQALDLKNNEVFMEPKLYPLQAMVKSLRAVLNVPGWFRGETTESDEAIQEEIVGGLIKGVSVERVGKSYVLELSYASPDPGLAAAITHAYADSYMTDQLDAKYEATRSAGEWLQKRIAELRQKSLETDLAVQKFKADHGLITSDGRLVSDQQLTEINSQLIIARSESASAEAKADRIKSIISSRDMQGAVTESLDSTIIADLRTKYLEASRKEADISSRLGRTHVQAVRLRNEMAEYQRLMFDELSRIAQGYQSNLDVARARENSLKAQVSQATSTSATANDAQVQLRELTRESQTYRKLYETFLQRYQESVQQQSFPVNEARVISEATVPDYPSSPKLSMALAASIFLGLVVGSGIGAFREFRDRFVRTIDQVREHFELEPLGMVPFTQPVELIKHKDSISSTVSGRVISKASPISNYVIDHPLSAFSETMRSSKIAIDVFIGQKKPKTVGIVSVLPGEGKSTISINFAELLASQGSRVLLIDADLRNPGATRQIARHAERGILEVLQDGAPVRDIIMINPDTKLAFLPAVIKRRIPYSSELLASEAMDRLVRDVSDAFDYIIFDLPPLAPVVDARAMSSKLDTYLFVVEWGKTARNVIKKTLIANSAVAAKCAGAILNKVDTERMKFYQTYGSSEFYYSRYSSYYRNE